MEKNKPYKGKVAGRFALIFLSVFLLAVAGCGGKKEEGSTGKAPAADGAKQAMPADHPSTDKATEAIAKASHSTIKTTKKVQISDEVRKKWTQVTLKITDRASNEAASVKLKVGSTVKLTDDGYHLKIEVLVPDYAIVEDRIESRSNEPKNPAVLVDLLQGEKTVARGWVFKQFPEFNSYNNKRFAFELEAP